MREQRELQGKYNSTDKETSKKIKDEVHQAKIEISGQVQNLLENFESRLMLKMSNEI